MRANGRRRAERFVVVVVVVVVVDVDAEVVDVVVGGVVIDD
jgi:hypothetical protein